MMRSNRLILSACIMTKNHCNRYYIKRQCNKNFQLDLFFIFRQASFLLTQFELFFVLAGTNHIASIAKKLFLTLWIERRI